MISSCYVFTFTHPFKQGFTYTSTVRCHLNGHGDEFVTPSGWLGLGLFVASLALYYAFSERTARLADSIAALSRPPLTSVAPDQPDAAKPREGERVDVV